MLQRLTFRIFISSAFLDMGVERRLLQDQIFPSVKKRAEALGANFYPIDLRWGISETVSLDQQMITVCLQEVDRCLAASNGLSFILLLGEHYGVCPLPPRIDAVEFDAISKRLKPLSRKLVNQWYRLDDNAVPSEYRLLSRKHLNAPKEEWSKVEDGIRSAFLVSIDEIFPKNDPRRSKYELSTTHQEFRRATSNGHRGNGRVLVYFRDANSDSRVQQSGKPGIVHFKEEIKNVVPASDLRTYKLFTESASHAAEETAFCQMLEQDLMDAIQTGIQNSELLSDLKREINTHRSIATAHAEYFVGQQDILGKLENYLEVTDAAADTLPYSIKNRPDSNPVQSSPLLITGQAGAGKSAILGKVAHLCEQDQRFTVVYRFLGLTPDCSDEALLLRSLCSEIGEKYADGTPVPWEYRLLVEEFRRRLALATQTRPLILILDGLEQIAVAGIKQSIEWLPQDLPPYVRIVISVLDKPQNQASHIQRLVRMLPAANMLPVQRLSPLDAEKLLELRLDSVKRTMTREQKRMVLTSFEQTPIPLYLVLSFEEARRWRSFDPPVKLAPDVLGMLLNLFYRLEHVDGHGGAFVSSTLGYMGASRFGLTEDEILDLVSLPGGRVMAEFHREYPESPAIGRIAWILWSRLLNDIKPYLSERSAQIAGVQSFYHSQFREAVKLEFLDKGRLQAAHEHIAVYFRQKGFRNQRVVQEIAYHQTEAGLWPALEQTLTSLSYLFIKADASGIFSVLQDFEHAFGQRPYASFSTLIQEVFRAIVSGIGQLSAYPRGILNHLQLRLGEGFILLGDLNDLQELDLPPMLCTFQALPQAEYHTGMIIDGTLTGNGSLLATAGADGMVVIRDVQSQLGPRILAAGESAYNVVKFSPDSRLLAVGRDDGTILIFATDIGDLVAELHDHELPVLKLAWSPNGSWLASAGGVPRRYDWDVRVWSTWDWQLREKYKGGGSPVRTLEFFPDSAIIASGGLDYRGVHLFSLSPEEPVRSISLQNEVHSLVVSPDGKWIYAATDRLELLSTTSFESVVSSSPYQPGRSPLGHEIVRPKLGLIKEPSRIFAAVPLPEMKTGIYGHDPSTRLLSPVEELKGEFLAFASSPSKLLLQDEESIHIYEPETLSLLASLQVQAGAAATISKNAAAIAGSGARVLYAEQKMREPQEDKICVVHIVDSTENTNSSRTMEFAIGSGIGMTVSTGLHGRRCLIENYLIDLDSGSTVDMGPPGPRLGSLRPELWMSENEDFIVRSNAVTVMDISPASAPLFEAIGSAMISRTWYIVHGVTRLPNHTIVRFGRADKVLLAGTHLGHVFIYTLGKTDQHFGVFPRLNDEISAAAWSEDGSLVAVGTASGQVAVGFVPEEIPLLGNPPLNWLFVATLHAVRVEHIAFCADARRQAVISIDNQRVLSICDLAVNDTVQLLLPGQMIAMRQINDTIASVFEGGETIVRWSRKGPLELVESYKRLRKASHAH
jgi:WD40 repeat protein